ncbi:MAG TPA: type II toxin-antitoxin system RelE/ParE family toxin [Caulobacteraceae bacterium]|jgi:mRNA interferase RelE/StbE|nr:type II toxin-antitoxin system RelE/ParE family toxin [Caulobacteraceae bacterium]
MAWRIEFDPAARKELDALGSEPARRILKFLSGRLAVLDDPRAIGEALRGSRFGSLWKYRIGDYRLVADIQDQIVLIVIVRVGHRSAVYRR